MLHYTLHISMLTFLWQWIYLKLVWEKTQTRSQGLRAHLRYLRFAKTSHLVLSVSQMRPKVMRPRRGRDDSDHMICTSVSLKPNETEGDEVGKRPRKD